jgi:hypothetical protein
LKDDEIPNVVALGRQITQNTVSDPQAEAEARKFSQVSAVPLEDPAKKKASAAE